MSSEVIVLGAGGTLVGNSVASVVFCDTLRQTQKTAAGGELSKSSWRLRELSGMVPS